MRAIIKKLEDQLNYIEHLENALKEAKDSKFKYGNALMVHRSQSFDKNNCENGTTMFIDNLLNN